MGASDIKRCAHEVPRASAVQCGDDPAVKGGCGHFRLRAGSSATAMGRCARVRSWFARRPSAVVIRRQSERIS
ncbi:hypothetical protein NAS2_1386 [Conexivisphaera calida]|uniref:Uncharacterized protein n=1 Tax=Conexivisphaera calida TaxID=1874277 RepID=A0A4P2VH69_9ARCH|nr:hypothetical protein NAS2_1386 [Conexivisphaera calida]